MKQLIAERQEPAHRAEGVPGARRRLGRGGAGRRSPSTCSPRTNISTSTTPCSARTARSTASARLAVAEEIGLDRAKVQEAMKAGRGQGDHHRGLRARRQALPDRHALLRDRQGSGRRRRRLRRAEGEDRPGPLRRGNLLSRHTAGDGAASLTADGRERDAETRSRLTSRRPESSLAPQRCGARAAPLPWARVLRPSGGEPRTTHDANRDSAVGARRSHPKRSTARSVTRLEVVSGSRLGRSC